LRKALTLLILLLSSGCAERPQLAPEEELRAAVLEIIEAVEERDPKTVLEYLAFDFREEEGLGYAEVQSIVLTYLLRDQKLGARLEELVIEPPKEGSETYRVRARTAFAQGRSIREPQQPLPADVVRYAFDLAFQRTENGWQAVGGRYERL
jgi:hypothetical protein